MSQPAIRLPQKGRSKEEVLASMQSARQHDIQWHSGKAFSLVFHAGEDVLDVLKEAYNMFFSENGLNPTAFPSLRKFEIEVVAMALQLLGGGEQAAGNMTSGGTESIMMAVLSAREWARRHKPDVQTPEMVLPLSAHPAFDKAAHYFGLKTVKTPLREDFRAYPEAMRAAVTPNTILLVGSAPAYPQGVVDPITEIAAIAQEHGLLMHTDACVGGFMLPFVRRLGYPVPSFDFSVPGVTSISADLHKYAYAAKGASVILYREHPLRRHQFFVQTDWPGGIYASPTMAGTRPGGAIAAAWAVLNYLGEEGYLSITDTVMKAARKIQDGVAAIPDVYVLSDPEMSVMAIASDSLDIYEVGDEMSQRGWHLDRQHFPTCLHLTVNYAHAATVNQFLEDLSAAVRAAHKPSWHKLSNRWTVRLANRAVRVLPERLVSRLMARSASLVGGMLPDEDSPPRQAAMYGLIGSLPNRGDVNQLVLDLIDSMTRTQ